MNLLFRNPTSIKSTTTAVILVSILVITAAATLTLWYKFGFWAIFLPTTYFLIPILVGILYFGTRRTVKTVALNLKKDKLLVEVEWMLWQNNKRIFQLAGLELKDRVAGLRGDVDRTIFIKSPVGGLKMNSSMKGVSKVDVDRVFDELNFAIDNISLSRKDHSFFC